MDACKKISTFLVLYDDGELDSDEAKEVAEHLQQCPHCTQELAELRRSTKFLLGYVDGEDTPQAAAPPAPFPPPPLLQRVPRALRWGGLLVLGGVLLAGLLFAVLSGRSPARPALTRLAEQLIALREVTATFSAVARYRPARADGIVQTDTRGTFYCRFPKDARVAKILCTEDWRARDAADVERATANRTLKWIQAGRQAHVWQGADADHLEAPTQTDIVSADLQPLGVADSLSAPQRMPYLLWQVLEALGRGAYLHWLDRPWQEAGVAPRTGSTEYRFVSKSPTDTLALGIELGEDGQLQTVRLSHTRPDADAETPWQAIAAFTVLAINRGEGDELISMPPLPE